MNNNLLQIIYKISKDENMLNEFLHTYRYLSGYSIVSFLVISISIFFSIIAELFNYEYLASILRSLGGKTNSIGEREYQYKTPF